MRITSISPKSAGFGAEITNIASDKSISHRAVIFAFLSEGESKIRNFLFGEDTLNTLKIAMQLGMRVFADGKAVQNITQIPQGAELKLLRHKDGILEADDILDCGNAGTAIRLYLGLLAGQSGKYFVLTGDKYLRVRPMGRVIAPLRSIGAEIYARAGQVAPITILGRKLSHFSFHSKISSAQVKTAMILAALNAESSEKSAFSEVSLSRNHSEKMLLGMGANLEICENKIVITPLTSPLKPLNLSIPSDPSSAFYFAILALITNSHIVLKNMLLNKTRIEAFCVLQKMGAKVEIKCEDSAFEEVGEICIYKDSALKAVELSENIAWLIDEIPALAVIFAFASGKSVVRNAKELRTKESDRIKATLQNLIKFGVECEEFEDGFSVCGGFKMPNKKVSIDSFGDHRIAMSFALFGAVCEVEVLDSACVDVSFPNFLEILGRFAEIENYEN
ncbi:3-phosphoshikimate 1-carboxyvinyltransferase [Helicobacter sp. 23-1044]